MEKVKVIVTNADIKDGMPRKSTQCPIALAIKRNIKDGIEVGVGCDEVWVGDNMAKIRNKKKIREFVRRFDLDEEVKPFQFTMYIP